jgi:hypothetical protein
VRKIVVRAERCAGGVATLILRVLRESA